MEFLRAEREAVEGVAPAKVIEEELRSEYEPPIATITYRRSKFMNGRLHDLRRGDEPTDVEDFTAPFNTPRYQTESARKDVPISHKVLDPEASPFSRIQVTLSPESADGMECFVQFLARRQLITNKTERFDNHPENYNTSRTTFKNMTREVNITASDELALLVEYTTGDSKQLSQRLRNAYAENPAATMREP